MGGEDRIARRFSVRGKVRRVGYRYFALTCAEALGIVGWARHAEDGVVEVHAEGAAAQLEEFEFDLRRGARFARVESVEKSDVGLEGLSGFEIRR